MHLFQHQVHHRGQAHAMLSATSVKPPQLDEFFSEGEAPLRAGEFAQLGWTRGADLAQLTVGRRPSAMAGGAAASAEGSTSRRPQAGSGGRRGYANRAKPCKARALPLARPRAIAKQRAGRGAMRPARQKARLVLLPHAQPV